ncbi:hypothetical protein [Rhabdothermincola salaria]|uniref:hypothetical protein n=1 Tax=Rhabdothermincola salaria TaxID=2903142 RepID=UPI001E624418|nr:hypothetical protein [Rhabdothermincola salaria]MCD9623931.1 hypothetical protein [Rhabdothermincola salaria]
MHPHESNAPEIEWVFGCNTVLGYVAAGQRHSRFNGHRVPYRPDPDLTRGARWCSTDWLTIDRGQRGFAARDQAGLSRMGMFVTGQVDGGLVVVVDDEDLGRAVVAVRALVDSSARRGDGPTEWSMALVRATGRTRPALRLGVTRDDDAIERALAHLTREVPVEWAFWFASGMGDLPDVGKLLHPDGTTWAQPEGAIYLESEPVPVRLVELAAIHGNGLASTGPSPIIRIDDESWRPLEDDELTTDHDLSPWLQPD